MANDTNILNIDTLNLTNVDDYTLIDIIRKKSFPKIPYQNDIQEDMFHRIAEETAADFFVKLLKKSPELFVVSNISNGSTPEIEYLKLSDAISISLKHLSSIRNGVDMTGALVNLTGDETPDYSTGSPYVKNLLVNEKLLLLIHQYIDFQKDKSYPSSENIVVTYSDGIVEFSIKSNIEDGGITTVTVDADVMDELDTFDEFITQIIEDLTDDEDDVYSLKKLSRVSDYSIPTISYKTKGLFKCDGEKLTTFHTGSVSSKNRNYYIPVFNGTETAETSRHQFDISFGHINGSGSRYVENEENLLPSKTIFRKYLVECFGRNTGKFTFKNNKNGDYFYVIQIDRDLFKDRLDAGNFELCLAPLSSSANQLYNTGSNFSLNRSSSVFFTLIDESNDTREVITNQEGIQDYYYITSGSLRDGVYGEPEDDAWGVVFPKMGLIVLDGVVLDQSCSFNTVTASIDGDNIRKLFVSISGSATPTLFRTQTGSFFARSVEECLVETYFCRAYYNEFNYSNNYTYTTGSLGEVKNLMFKKEPNSYITSIGLYNRNNDLVAIGKLPQPLLKNEGTEYVFQVKVRLN